MQFDLFGSAQNKILGAPSYVRFKKELTDSQCALCGLAAGRTHLVVDRGNPEAKVLFIGEAPGQNEDLQGRAFVGRAGRLLDEMLKSLGFNTDLDSLIVNVVKCKAEVDRAPFSGEVDACLPYLRRQIELMRPKVILLLGAVALKYLVKDRGDEFSMEKEAGHFFTAPEYPDAQVMVLYHPAFLLRDPTKKAVMWEHIKKLRTFLTEHGWMPQR